MLSLCILYLPAYTPVQGFFFQSGASLLGFPANNINGMEIKTYILLPFNTNHINHGWCHHVTITMQPPPQTQFCQQA